VLYELLTSEVPFPGENFVAVAMRHINEPPPSVRDKRPDISPRLGAAVERAMAKQPEDRFQTMAEFCRELEANLAEAQGTAVMAPLPEVRRARPPRPGANPWPIVLALAVLIAIGAVIAYLLVSRDTGSPASNTGGGDGGAAPHLVGATAYDPHGDGGEHNDKTGLATDGVGATYWETERYFDTPSLNKDGVGLVLDAQRPVRLHQLGIATSTPGFTASIRAGDSSSGPFPDTVAAAQTVTDGTQYTITSDSPHRYYLIWITRLGTDYNTARINEVSAT